MKFSYTFSNNIYYLCRFESRDEHDDEGKMGCNSDLGTTCPVKITDSYGPAFMTKSRVTKPLDHSIVNGLRKCWKAIVVTLLLACLAGIALWIAVSWGFFSLTSLIPLPNIACLKNGFRYYICIARCNLDNDIAQC